MNITEYQKQSLLRLNPLIRDNKMEGMKYALLGIGEETGEIIGEIRKSFFKGNYHEKEFDIKELSKELGDLLWYMSFLCKIKKIDIRNIENVEENNNKIKSSDSKEILIEKALELEKKSGYVVEIAEDDRKEEIKNALKEQYTVIRDIANEIGITMEEIFEQNIEKVNGRYDRKGMVKENEGEER